MTINKTIDENRNPGIAIQPTCQRQPKMGDWKLIAINMTIP